ncbi:hypothetical protein CLIB1444_02S06612 [[Candida] jaroonii]|uniref:Uncharacterized protein n=1 Tax=[Candida] jaroonii TaxID=467808 RepID=A0ACA9Y317_9ASCO|nr:hypothetical protein CLIB1444_02S06612 [[Candida] jaroonii]
MPTFTFNTALKDYKEKQLSTDLKIVGSIFIATLIVLFHYAYIMKQLLDNPSMEYSQLFIQFSLFLITSSAVLYILITKVLPAVSPNSTTENIEKAKKNR